MVALSFPLNGLLDGSAVSLFLAMAIAVTVNGLGGGMHVAWFAELFSTRQRATGVGLAVSLSVALFGGLDMVESVRPPDAVGADVTRTRPGRR